VLKPSSVDAQKKRVSFPSPQEVFHSSFPLAVMILKFGFDMFVRCYECMWVNYYVGDLLRFFVGIKFQFPNPIGRSLNLDRRSKTFPIFSSIHRPTNEVSLWTSYFNARVKKRVKDTITGSAHVRHMPKSTDAICLSGKGKRHRSLK